MKNNGQMDLIGGETSIGMNVIKPIFWDNLFTFLSSAGGIA